MAVDTSSLGLFSKPPNLRRTSKALDNYRTSASETLAQCHYSAKYTSSRGEKHHKYVPLGFEANAWASNRQVESEVMKEGRARASQSSKTWACGLRGGITSCRSRHLATSAGLAESTTSPANRPEAVLTRLPCPHRTQALAGRGIHSPGCHVAGSCLCRDHSQTYAEYPGQVKGRLRRPVR